ncbi:MAG: CheR family methyltransferase [Bryobacteraceae bacterium]
MLLALAIATVTWQDLDPTIRSAFSRQGAAFDAWVRSVAAENQRRMAEGEADHLIHYVLQSRAFTTRTPIEPALSAKDHHDRSAIPNDASRRIDDFLASNAHNPRLDYFRKLAAGRRSWIAAEYERAMRFLYAKEWESRDQQGQARRDAVAQLYRTRGHSTDTSLDASFSLDAAIGVLAEQGPRVRRALLIGPGLDIAPRTAFREDAPPQSVQPYALADSLLQRGLARADQLEIVCADINPRVVQWIGGHPRRLQLFWNPTEPDHVSYFANLGSAIGTRQGQALEVKPEIAARIRAEQLDIATSIPAGSFDLIAATNVLVYFNREEFGLALQNIARALAPGGFFLHNENRDEVEPLGAALGIPVIHARMVRLPGTRALYDTAVIHAKPR